MMRMMSCSPAPLGHEVDHARAAAAAGHLGLEHQGVWPIPLLDAQHLRGGMDGPVAVVVVAKQLGEASIGVDARQAQPVDRAVARYQGDGR